jgi:hypothetical protein
MPMLIEVKTAEAAQAERALDSPSRAGCAPREDAAGDPTHILTDVKESIFRPRIIKAWRIR